MSDHLKFTYIQEKVYHEYIKNGYLDMWNVETLQEQSIYDISELALILTEISELIECIRKGKTPNDDEYRYELADIIIRTLNFSSRKDIIILPVIIEKHLINMERKKLHGKVV